MMVECREDKQGSQKFLLVLICNDPVVHQGAQEGLRFARGLAQDGRWKVTVLFCEAGLNPFRNREVGKEDEKVSFLQTLAEVQTEVTYTAILPRVPIELAFPDWVLMVESDAGVQLGVAADVLLKF